MKMRALIALSALLVLSGCSYDIPQATTVQKYVAPIEQKVNSNKTAEEKQTQVEDVRVAPIEEKATSTPVVEQVPVVVEQPKIEQAPVVEKVQETAVPLSNDNSYINTDGIEVHSPAFAPSIAAGASARCRDGTYSFSLNRRGTCSHHGGVEEWL